ncbi:hypothetical protein ACWDY7_30030 [Streptomyces calvus]|uniref:Uncharacterized protein n=1 Tax=Streptomyces calvus TaxID=67282 RepID=A0AA40SK25_9ACTN|nr:hypothetical protein [Streptomyces calvus]MBA8947917.1 hypothetical protein [Streptomyces calvus]GGP81477.1 hypothetical protein GCM10010247_63460 [Streptomyces calvus]
MPADHSARDVTARPQPPVPMRDLLAACAAAAAVSTPPRAPEPRRCEPVEGQHREAA